MTSDEAIGIMNVIVHMLEPQYDTDRIEDAVEMAIKALEQQPCEDVISRQATLDAIIKRLGIKNETYLLEAERVIYQQILAMPYVTPQPKMGKWRAFTHSAYHGNDEDGEPIWREVTVYHCNLCNRRTVIKEKYCPNCGAKMQEVEE